MRALRWRDEAINSTIPRGPTRLPPGIGHSAGWVCGQCGESYFEEREVDTIQGAIAALDQQAEQLVKGT